MNNPYKSQYDKEYGKYSEYAEYALELRYDEEIRKRKENVCITKLIICLFTLGIAITIWILCLLGKM